MSSVFATNDPQKIVKELAYICGNGSIEGSESLLFLDEIQAVPEAIHRYNGQKIDEDGGRDDYSVTALVGIEFYFD